MGPAVLIVDDEEGIRKLLADILEMRGFEVCQASNGKEGLRQLYDRRPDLVVSDVRMPDMDGYEFCHLVRQACDVPIMIITGIGPTEDKIQRLTADVDEFMAKPLTLGDFVERVSFLTGLRRA
ncbi:MAG: response regulator [SAR202 cluster bacterium]|jgi:DNA-binding response OmpR family regulator|nr:response regulator [SAR202 cluster bacterium]